MVNRQVQCLELHVIMDRCSVLSYRAYQRTNEPYLRNAAIGFAVVAFGVFLEGVFFELLEWDLVTVHIIESLVVAVGLAIILFSLLR